jgi:crotonobetainyl-CoA:carnitine CoA-transferase CaiB-like acyl-CoA transferase
MSKPFAGVRILDFTRYLAGPYGTYQLALLGADVVKIESQEGDETRGQLADKKWAERKMAPSFLAVNGNKRSITLDLRKPEAVEIVKRLVVGADVVWENFRGGVMDRLGLGYEALSAINPRLIYCGVSGFGRTGPEKATAAFDGKLQAMSGIMSITGHADKGPTRAGFALCDTISGMTSAFAVASALFQRSHTGLGQFVDVAMLDAALSFLSPQIAEYTVTGHKHKQYGNLSTTGKVTGKIRYGKIIIEEGGQLSGEITFGAAPAGSSSRLVRSPVPPKIMSAQANMLAMGNDRVLNMAKLGMNSDSAGWGKKTRPAS